jgi:glycerophosphoryl diester phosphodiesterase
MELISYPTAEAHFGTLDRSCPSEADRALAIRHAPRIRFDAREPFVPLAVGYTVFRRNGPSPSFPREISLPANAACAVEYAIWWDWDIQHLYELEHIWLYLDAQERLIAAEASWHGGQHPMLDARAQLPVEDGKLTLYSEPGKHAFAPERQWLLDRAPVTTRSCTTHSGKMGVLVTPLFEGIIHDRLPVNDRAVHTYLERLAFQPSFEFTHIVDLAQAVFVPWKNLATWIPSRVTWWVRHLHETIPPRERRFLRIAHRGASAYAQESSVASVEKAAELGADMVEVDVRVTKDGIPVIAHDPDLRRVFGIHAQVADLTLDEIRTQTPAAAAPLLTFADMVELCARLGLGLYLDIKEITPAAFGTVSDALRKHSLFRYAIFGAFRPDVVAEIKHNIPEALTSILFSSPHIEPVSLARSVKADYVHPCFERFDTPQDLIAGDWMDRVRAAGLGVICWHEERPAVIAGLQALGVDGVCSDQPELLRTGT